MKFAIALALAAITLISLRSFADGPGTGSYDDKTYDASKATSCIVVLQKHGSADDPTHYEMDCDGYRFMYQQTADVSQLGNPVYLESALTGELQKRMVMTSNTVCKTGEDDNVWYTNCYRASSFGN